MLPKLTCSLSGKPSAKTFRTCVAKDVRPVSLLSVSKRDASLNPEKEDVIKVVSANVLAALAEAADVTSFPDRRAAKQIPLVRACAHRLPSPLALLEPQNARIDIEPRECRCCSKTRALLRGDSEQRVETFAFQRPLWLCRSDVFPFLALIQVLFHSLLPRNLFFAEPSECEAQYGGEKKRGDTDLAVFCGSGGIA
ncbi:hypothetical protein MRX96_015430 [Rhipicephalus microplus]